MIRLTEIPDLQPTQINAPQVNPSAAMAAGKSLGTVAQGIAKFGEAFSEHAEKIQGFENAYKESTIRNQWLTGYSAVTAENDKDPDPTSRQARTAEFLQKQKATLDDPDMAPVVRQRLTLHYDDFAGKATMDTVKSAAAVSSQRSILALNNGVETSLAAGNMAGVEREIETGVANGILLPEEADRIRRDATETLGKRERQRQALEEPDIFLDTTTDTAPEGVDPVEWANLRSTAKRSLAQDTAATSADINDGIATGNITRPEQIDELAPNLRPAVKERFKEELAARADATTRAMRLTPGYQAATVTKVKELLAAYDVEADGYDSAFVEMDTLVRSLPPSAVRDELTRQLDRSRNGQLGQLETAADFHRQQLDELHEVGAFGSGLKSQPVDKILADGILRDPAKLQRRGFSPEQAAIITAAEVSSSDLEAAGIPEKTAGELAGKITSESQRVTLFRELSKVRSGFDQSTEYERAALDAIQKGDKGLIEFPDLASREKARRAYGLAKTKLEDWLKRNPEATDEQAREAILRITGATAIPGMVDQILDAPPSMDLVLPPKPDQ